MFVIDLYPQQRDYVRNTFPKIYQILLDRVEPERIHNPIPYRRDNWWLFGQPSTDLREAQEGLAKIIITARQGRHRIFSLAPSDAVPESTVVVIAADDQFILGILQSRIHEVFSLKAGGWLGVGNDTRYFHTKTFDPFPFPSVSELLKSKIRSVAEELDTFRKQRQKEHPDLTLTQMYNVLGKLKAKAPLDEDDEAIKDKGLILILKELHERLDALVFEAYGWPQTVSDEQILEKLVALNHERAAEEKRGHVRWLRPDYQIPRFGQKLDKQAAKEEGAQVAADLGLPEPGARRPAFPTDAVSQTAAVFAALASARQPIDADAIAAGFRKTKNLQQTIEEVLGSLSRLGHVATRNGKTFELRRVA